MATLPEQNNIENWFSVERGADGRPTVYINGQVIGEVVEATYEAKPNSLCVASLKFYCSLGRPPETE